MACPFQPGSANFQNWVIGSFSNLSPNFPGGITLQTPLGNPGLGYTPQALIAVALGMSQILTAHGCHVNLSTTTIAQCTTVENFISVMGAGLS